jgi:type IV secretory pathway VirB4 component
MANNPLLALLPFGKKAGNNPAGTDPEKLREQELQDQIQQFSMGLVSIQDIIAPEAIEVDFTFQKINSLYTRTLFISGFPRMVPANWLSPLINFPYSLSIAMHITPVDIKEILHDLRRKITEMEAEITSDIRSGKISNIDTEVKLEDAKTMQEQLAKGAERFYQFGLYVTLVSPNLPELDKMTRQLQSLLGSMLLISKKASLQMDEGFKTTLPMGIDKLKIQRNMDTTSLATTFPFTSSELTMDRGIVYGINEHNGSLVIFDRFSLENANMVVFAKSGAGKSYAVKLEAIRQLMFDCEVLILDPEKEYEDMTRAVGGEYINFSFDSHTKINPFDLSTIYEEGENELGQKIISLHTLLKVMIGEMGPEEEATLDRALVAAYKAKGITPDPETQTREPPLMEDLYKALIGMENKAGQDLALRLEKYIKGSFRGIFDQPTNINIKNQLTVFSVRDIEDELRPVAMFLILDFIWTRIRKERRKRMLIVDEAWYFMKYKDTASFLHSIAKRARKYYLGVTTITQDVEDFMHNDYGKAIVTNASIQLLLKQSSAAIPILTETFYLSEGEQRLLMAADVGEGLFFAGQNHVAIRVMAAPEEHVLITTNPEELAQIRSAQAQQVLQEQNLQQTTQAVQQFGQPTP